MSSYAYIPEETSVQILTEPGILTGVFVTSGGALDIYDTPNGTTTGTIVIRFNPDQSEFVSLPNILVKTGLYAVSHSQTFTVFYE